MTKENWAAELWGAQALNQELQNKDGNKKMKRARARQLCLLGREVAKFDKLQKADLGTRQKEQPGGREGDVWWVSAGFFCGRKSLQRAAKEGEKDPS